MATRAKRPRKVKAKKVNYELIERESAIGRPMYALLGDLMRAHHEDLCDARIALAWCTSWKADVDGRLTLGKCVKATDLHRELAPIDFVVLLNRDFYTNPRVTALQRRALIDHELCHGAAAYDAKGEPVEDERGRRVYRFRRHDLEEFAVIGERYGCWKNDITNFAMALARAEDASVPGYWINGPRLHELLQTVGLVVPLEEIQTWSQVERKECEEWARIRIDLGTKAQTPALALSEPARIAAFRAKTELPFGPAPSPAPPQDAVTA